MRVNIDPALKTTFPPEIVDLAVAALNNRNGKVLKNVELQGTFPVSGAVKFICVFGFDMAVCKADCEFFVDGRSQRFAGEVMVNQMMNAYAWWPRFGWAPILVPALSVVQLQGRPGDSWSVIGSVVEKPTDRNLFVPAPTIDGDIINCAKYIDAVPFEGRL